MTRAALIYLFTTPLPATYCSFCRAITLAISFWGLAFCAEEERLCGDELEKEPLFKHVIWDGLSKTNLCKREGGGSESERVR
ncbi:hypothetical protein BDZ91DRAFT_522121 [Kalaharituber pfeilii]|nr:hypothetical protein BDZ91DRAFT_522121 [Kalaharituber pfeilii]